MDFVLRFKVNTNVCKQTVHRQLDCLRQLVVVLCERSQLQDLVQFPYVNLHDEVKLSSDLRT